MGCGIITFSGARKNKISSEIQNLIQFTQKLCIKIADIDSEGPYDSSCAANLGGWLSINENSQWFREEGDPY